MVTQALTIDRPLWNVGNERFYDVWGGVRSGAATGGPKGRCCANLGHVQDDESGLIYVRARYYEPSMNRFISEDPGMADGNWFTYAKNLPTVKVDSTGRVSEEDKYSKLGISVLTALGSLSWFVYTAVGTGVSLEAKMIAWSGLVFLASWFQIELWTPMGDQSLAARVKAGGMFFFASFVSIGGPVMNIVRATAGYSPAEKAVDVVKTYSAVLMMFFALESLQTQ